MFSNCIFVIVIVVLHIYRTIWKKRENNIYRETIICFVLRKINFNPFRPVETCRNTFQSVQICWNTFPGFPPFPSLPLLPPPPFPLSLGGGGRGRGGGWATPTTAPPPDFNKKLSKFSHSFFSLCNLPTLKVSLSPQLKTTKLMATSQQNSLWHTEMIWNLKAPP